MKNGRKYTIQITEGRILLPFTPTAYAKAAEDDQNSLPESQGTHGKRSSSQGPSQICDHVFTYRDYTMSKIAPAY